MEIQERLKEALHQVNPDVALDNITEDTRLGDDLGIDSMRMLMLMMTLEDTMGIRFPEKARFETVGEVLMFLNGEQEKK